MKNGSGVPWTDSVSLFIHVSIERNRNGYSQSEIEKATKRKRVRGKRRDWVNISFILAFDKRIWHHKKGVKSSQITFSAVNPLFKRNFQFSMECLSNLSELGTLTLFNLEHNKKSNGIERNNKQTAELSFVDIVGIYKKFKCGWNMEEVVGGINLLRIHPIWTACCVTK